MRVITIVATLTLTFGLSLETYAECDAQRDPPSFLSHEFSGSQYHNNHWEKVTITNNGDRAVLVNINVSHACPDRERVIEAGGSNTSTINWWQRRGYCGFPEGNPYKCCNPAGNDMEHHCKEPEWGFVPGEWREGQTFSVEHIAIQYMNLYKSNDGSVCSEMADNGGACCIDSQDLTVVQVGSNWQLQYAIPSGCYGKKHEPDWVN